MASRKRKINDTTLARLTSGRAKAAALAMGATHAQAERIGKALWYTGVGGQLHHARTRRTLREILDSMLPDGSLK